MKKIVIIGATGNLGKRVARKAVEAGFVVKAIIRSEEGYDLDTEILKKDLFDLTLEDIADADIIFSAFGSGFQADPVVNERVYDKYIELMSGTSKKLFVIAGAGCLYTDKTHTLLEYRAPYASSRLYGISGYTTCGVEKLIKQEGFKWTVICPSRKFDAAGPYTGNYLIGEDRTILYNESGESYLTYEDMAGLLIELFKSDEALYDHKIITAVTKTVL